MAFFDFLNKITAPVGLKLFPGGPYADSGLGDVQQKEVQQYMAQLAPIIAQIASAAGVTNPLTPGQPGQFSNDPYGLSPLQQAEVNQQAGIDRKATDAILARVKADLSARGLGDSSTLTAAETYLNEQLGQQLGTERIQAGQNAYQNRMSALQAIAGLLGQGYGAQSNVTASQKNTAIQSNQNSMNQLGSLLAMGLYAGGVGPFGKAPSASSPVIFGGQPGQAMNFNTFSNPNTASGTIYG